CKELKLHHYYPLWGMDRETLLNQMLDSGMKIIFSAVAAHGLDQSWLGKPLNRERATRLKELNQNYGVDMCGEGGEYESLVIDAPWLKHKIEIIEADKTWDGFSGRYLIKKAMLFSK
ncbi:TIGR00289 family protein, partial [Thermoproteota archaeon]